MRCRNGASERFTAAATYSGMRIHPDRSPTYADGGGTGTATGRADRRGGQLRHAASRPTHAIALLEANGIQASGKYGDAGGWMPHIALLDGFRVLVFDDDLDRAKALLEAEMPDRDPLSLLRATRRGVGRGVKIGMTTSSVRVVAVPVPRPDLLEAAAPGRARGGTRTWSSCSSRWRRRSPKMCVPASISTVSAAGTRPRRGSRRPVIRATRTRSSMASLSRGAGCVERAAEVVLVRGRVDEELPGHDPERRDQRLDLRGVGRPTRRAGPRRGQSSRSSTWTWVHGFDADARRAVPLRMSAVLAGQVREHVTGPPLGCGRCDAASSCSSVASEHQLRPRGSWRSR